MYFEEKYRQRLLERLSCIDNEKKHRRLRKIRHHGTGMWIADLELFKNWNKEPGSSCLCCYGIRISSRHFLRMYHLTKVKLRSGLGQDNTRVRVHAIIYIVIESHPRVYIGQISLILLLRALLVTGGLLLLTTIAIILFLILWNCRLS
jgi:hypothetical protein